jgi:hypothetical protein
MAMAIWRPGRRLFTVAGVLMILTSAAHTAGNLAGGPPEPAQAKVLATMAGYHIPMGMGMNPSIEDIFWSLTFMMSVTLTAVGVLNLILAASADATDALLRRVGWFNAIWVAGFIALNVKYQLPPPLISGMLIEVFVLAALLTGRKKAA